MTLQSLLTHGLRMLTIATLLLGSESYASKQVALLEQGEDDLFISPYLSYYQDLDGSMTIDNVTLAPEDAFTQIQRSKYVLENSNSPYWLKFSVKNESLEDRELSLDSMGTEALEFVVYAKSNHEDTYRILGSAGIRGAKNSIHSYPQLKFTLKGQETQNFIIKLVSLRFNVAVIHIRSVEASAAKARLVWGSLSLYIGCMLSLIIYNLFVYLALRDKAYLWYVSFGIVMLMTVSLSTRYFTPYSLFRSEEALKLGSNLLSLAPGIASLFCRSFLKLPKYSPRLNTASIVLFCLASLTFILGYFFEFSPAFAIAKINNVLLFILVIYSSKSGLSRGFRAAQYYLLAWSAFFIAVVYWTLGQTNVIETNYLNSYSGVIGNLAEMLLMSLALSQRLGDLEMERSRAIIMAKQGDGYKRLVRVLCHDIANPLSIMTGFASIAKMKSDDPKLTAAIGKIERAGKIIEDLIQSVRDMESLSAKNSSFTITPVSLNYIFDHLKFIFSNKLQSKEIKLELPQLSPDIYVMAEARSLASEVFSNLISNAIKFSDEGSSITISVTASNKLVSVQVADRGTGIPEKILPNIFDSKVLESNLGTKQEKGTGIGMPLVYDFVKLYGAKIEISSTYRSEESISSGTEITLHFKRAATTPPSMN